MSLLTKSALAVLIGMVCYLPVQAQVFVFIMDEDQGFMQASRPVDDERTYNFDQSLYFQSDINVEGPILQVAYYLMMDIEPSNWVDVDIYFNETSAMQLPSEPMDPGTLVYSGRFSYNNAEGWKPINLDTPYHYSNIDNLVVTVCQSGNPEHSEWTSWWRYHVPMGASNVHGYRGPSDTAIACPPESFSSRNWNRPDLRLQIDGVAPTATPAPPTPTPTATLPPTFTPTGLPTNTPLPTHTPAPPTNTPIPTHTPIPTNTPGPGTPTATPDPGEPTPTPEHPTHTPEPTNTPGPGTPTATPDPGDDCDTLGVSITMPSHMFSAGDICNVILHICNTEPDMFYDVPMFVILDVYGALFFWPDYSDFDYMYLDVIQGYSTLQILPDFEWPADVGAASGIHWYAGMTTPEIDDLIGEFGMWTFGWE